MSTQYKLATKYCNNNANVVSPQCSNKKEHAFAYSLIDDPNGTRLKRKRRVSEVKRSATLFRTRIGEMARRRAKRSNRKEGTLAVSSFCCDQYAKSLSMVTLMGLEPMLSA